MIASAPPSGFRGTWHTGERARGQAARISGPFRSDPGVYAIPDGPEDLVRLVSFARSEGLPLIPRGAGTGMPGGNLGRGVVFSLREGFADQAPVDDSSRTVRVGAGVTGDQVEALARSRNLTFPPLPSSARWCTVGGMVANNAAGARSFGHGAVHRWVESAEGVDASGERFVVGANTPGTGPLADTAALDRALDLEDPRFPPWPRVRKNSSGYALDRYRSSGTPLDLLTGSEGTLGILTAVQLRLHPRAAERGLLVLGVGDASEASELAVGAASTGAVACEFLGHRFLELAGLAEDLALEPLVRDAWALFLLEFEGDLEQVRIGLDEGMALADACGGSRSRALSTTDPRRIDDLWSLRRRASPLIAREAERGRISTQFIEDCVVPPHHLGDFLVGLDRILASTGFDAVIFGHAGDGNVHVNPLVDVHTPGWRDRVRRALLDTTELVAGLGGTMAGEHGDGRLRAPLLETIWGPEWCSAFRTVKDHFDPDGVLNPGVILPLPGQDPLEGLHPRKRSWPS